MGRKVHPKGFRLGVNKTWDGRWYAEGEDYTDRLHEDIEIRDLIRKHSPRAGVSRIEIERFPGKVQLYVHTAKPGVFIGRKGENVKGLRKSLEKLVGMKIDLEIKEVKDPDLDAHLIGQNIADQLKRRISYRRAMGRAVQQAMRAGAQGVKVEISGRLGGSDMARRVWDRDGRVPLHTLRADIDYAVQHAVTPYSVIGVKVWVYKGDILPEKDVESESSGGVYVSE
ncbi:MAG: 30S ribosomal protein S3 [Anaerolineae bacterium]|nr:30S ribosomal protein S3 [Anaerolineae bacterium]